MERKKRAFARGASRRNKVFRTAESRLPSLKGRGDGPAGRPKASQAKELSMTESILLGAVEKISRFKGKEGSTAVLALGISIAISLRESLLEFGYPRPTPPRPGHSSRSWHRNKPSGALLTVQRQFKTYSTQVDPEKWSTLSMMEETPMCLNLAAIVSSR